MEAGKKKAGRPRFGAERMTNLCVNLDRECIERAKLIGDGNVSAGIRMALCTSPLVPSSYVYDEFSTEVNEGEPS